MGGYADWSFCSFVVLLANVVLHIVHILQTVNMQNTPQVKGIDAQRCLFCKMLCSNDGEWFLKQRKTVALMFTYPCTIFSQGVGYITSSQWFWRNFECNRFPGHQVWILNATNFLKNWGGVKIAPCNAIQQVTFCYKQGLLLKSSSDTVIANCRGSCTL